MAKFAEGVKFKYPLSHYSYMQKQLEIVVVKLCEKLPFDMTLFEEKGACRKLSDRCSYCKKDGGDNYHCYKKTYITQPQLDESALS